MVDEGWIPSKEYFAQSIKQRQFRFAKQMIEKGYADSPDLSILKEIVQSAPPATTRWFLTQLLKRKRFETR